MSEKLCALRTQGGGGGAKQTETVLWTNSSPTSSFAKQDVTLSDDINNYDYLKFTYRVTTSVADFLNYIISVSDFKKSVENSSIQNCVLALSTDDSVAHTRRIYYKTDTTVNFNNSYQLNAVASNNATVIPTQIVGIKNMGSRGWAAGPMFDITASSGVYGSSNSYAINSTTNDSTLLSDYYVTTNSLTVTVKRAAKGKIYFNASMRGNIASHATVTIHNTSYKPYEYTSSDIQSGIDVNFAANDTVVFAAGTSGIFYNATMTFIED